MNPLERKARRILLETPLVKLEGIVSKMKPSEINRMVGYFDVIAEQAARRSAYFSTRFVSVTNVHERAVKAQNDVATKVRKALGYNVTDPITF